MLINFKKKYLNGVAIVNSCKNKILSLISWNVLTKTGSYYCVFIWKIQTCIVKKVFVFLYRKHVGAIMSGSVFTTWSYLFILFLKFFCCDFSATSKGNWNYDGNFSKSLQLSKLHQDMPWHHKWISNVLLVFGLWVQRKHGFYFSGTNTKR